MSSHIIHVVALGLISMALQLTAVVTTCWYILKVPIPGGRQSNHIGLWRVCTDKIFSQGSDEYACEVDFEHVDRSVLTSICILSILTLILMAVTLMLIFLSKEPNVYHMGLLLFVSILSVSVCSISNNLVEDTAKVMFNYQHGYSYYLYVMGSILSVVCLLYFYSCASRC